MFIGERGQGKISSKGYFVTGTDTDVGKTLIAGGLAAIYKDSGLNVGVMKPIATGCEWINNCLVSSDAIFLKSSAQTEDEYELVNPIRLEPPLAPTIAAQLSNKKVDLNKVCSAYDALRKRHDYMIVEGAGGLLTPVDERHFIMDVAKEMGLPLIVVCRPTLGTINHTLLTVFYARENGLDVKGIIVNESIENCDAIVKRTNVNEIKRLAKAPIVGVVPFDKRLDIRSCNREVLIEILGDKIDKNIIM